MRDGDDEYETITNNLQDHFDKLFSIIAELPAEEENLDPASQTGDFVFPSASEPTLSELFAEAVEGIDADDIVVSDLAHLEELIYHYADGREFSVLHPLQRSIGPDGSHYITCADRVGIEVPVVGLLKIEHFPRFDEACFPGHIPVNEIER